MQIVIVGLGYVGVTAAACLATTGHEVIGVDVNEHKVNEIRNGSSPIIEPNVGEMIAKAVENGTITAQAVMPDLTETDIVIVCVGTPSAPDGSHNMGFIAESARQIAAAIQNRKDSTRAVTVAFRSTFRPGSMDTLIAPIFSEALGSDFNSSVELVYNPEFLRESTAVADYFSPPKIVIGTSDGLPSERMTELNTGITAPTFIVPFREAEITKFIDNTWHAVKVAFANEVGRVCAAYDVDSEIAHQIFVADTKLNISPYYTRPGGAFGGSCLPKDVRAMQYIAESGGAETQLFDSLITSNESHKTFQLRRVQRAAKAGARILVAGLAFKAGTDDMRESPTVTLVSQLISAGYVVEIFDPYVHTSSLMGQNLGYVLSAIPNLREILVDAERAAASTYDLVVVTNATGGSLPEISAPRIDISRIDRPSTESRAA